MYETLEKLLDDALFKEKVNYSTKIYHVKDKILEQGKLHKYVHLIKTGSVRVVLKAQEQQKDLLHPGIADLAPGDVFGEFGLFDDSPASADVIAVQDSEIVEIDILSFREFLENNPKIGYKLLIDMLVVIIDRLRRANKSIYSLYSWGLKAHKLDQHLE